MNQKDLLDHEFEESKTCKYLYKTATPYSWYVEDSIHHMSRYKGPVLTHEAPRGVRGRGKSAGGGSGE